MALIDEQQPESGFGLSLFKSAKQAYKEDVAPRAQADDPYAAFRDTGPAIAQAGQDDPYAAFREPSAPAKPTSVSSSNFGRGWDVSGKQLKQTAYGTAALIGDTFGSDSLKKWGLQGYKDAEKEIQAISKESDSFTSAVQSGDIGSWLTYSAGYLAGQFADLAVASAAGAVVGGSLSGPAAPAGAAAGAVTGAINKAAVQTGLRGAVSKMIDKEAASLTAKYIERGMVKEAAEKAAAEAAVTSVYRTIGATTANTFLNATGELGSIYGEAVEEAAKTGQEYSLGKIWLSGIAATAVDTWADSKAVKGLTDAFKGKSRVSSIAMEAFKGGMREGLTEGTQTVIERWGADKDLTSKEAFKEYIDSAAVGVLGGTAAGGASGAVSKLQANTGKPEVDQTQANFTKLPESQSGRTRPLDEADTPAMPQGEMLETLSNPGFVAALYQQSSDIEKQILRSAVERAGFQEAFGKALQDPDQIAYGAKMIQNNPDFVQTFMSAVEPFATTQSPAGVFKADKRGAKPQISEEEEFEQRAQQDGFTLTERPGGPAPAAAPRPGRVEPEQPSSDTRTVTDEEEQRAPIENRDELIAKFNGIGNEIFGGEMTPPKEARYDWAMKQLIDAGFKPAEARSILTGETKPTVAEQSAPNLEEQGALDEAVDTAENQQPADTTAGTDQAADDAALPKDIRGVKMTEKNRPLLDAYFSDEIAAVQKQNDTKGKTERLAQLERQALRVGFSQADVDQMFGRQQAAAQTRLTEPKVTRNSPPADPNASWSPTVTLDYGDYTIENDGASAVYDMKAPVELSSAAKLTGLVANPKRLTLVTQNASGQNFKVRVQGDHIRLEKLETAQSRDYEFDGSNSADLDRILGSELMSRLDKAKPEERVGIVLEAVTKKLGLDNLDRFSAEFDNMRQGKPQTETKTESQQARTELQDALANLGDVLTDALGTKQNITGQRYTMADVPDALVKVMKALLKAGVAQFKDASAQLMQKMRANPDWAPLADKVDQGMLLKAWNAAGGKPSQRIQSAPEGPAATLRSQTRAVKTSKGDQLITNQNPISARQFYMSPEEAAENERRAEEERFGDREETGGEKAPVGDDLDGVTMVELKEGKGKSNPAASYYRQALRDAKAVLSGRLAMVSPEPGKKPQPTRLNSFMLDKMGFDVFDVRLLDDSSGASARKLAAIRDEMSRNVAAVKQKAAASEKKGNAAPKAEEAATEVKATVAPRPKAAVAQRRFGDLRKKIDEMFRFRSNASYYTDVIRSLEKRLAEIDELLKQSDRFTDDDGKTFVAKRGSTDSRPGEFGYQDENAYDRFLDGQVFDKSSPKNELMDIRRRLVEDLSLARQGSREGMAKMYTLGQRTMRKHIRNMANRATRLGMSPGEAQAIANEYLQALDVIAGKDRAQDVPESINTELEEANKRLIEEANGYRVIGGLLGDLKAGRISRREYEALEARGLREGDFTLEQLLRAYQDLGISPEQRIYAGLKHFSARTSLKEYVAQHNGAASAVDAYFLDMMGARDLMPDTVFRATYSPADRDKLVLWQQQRRAVLGRRRTTDKMVTGADPRKAFDGFLFTRITLEEARNPDLIQNLTLRQTYKSLFDNLEEAWFSDLAAALRLRPDLAGAMFEPQYRVGERTAVASDPIISAQERKDFQSWIDRLKAGIQKQAEVLARAPYFTALRNDPMLDAVTTPEGFPMVASTPQVDVKQTGRSADLESQEGRGVRRAEYEVMYTKVMAGELEAVQELLDFNARMRAMQVGSIDPETGEIITQQMYDELAADALDSILMNAAMSPGYDAGKGKSIQGDGKGVQTIEELADQLAGGGKSNQSALEDLSVEDQLNEGVSQDELIAQTKNMGESSMGKFERQEQDLDEEDLDTEVGEDSSATDDRGADEAPAEAAAEEPVKAGPKIPKSLVPGMEYRFRRGKAWDVFSMTAVQDIVNRLTAGWKNATNVIVLPNAQHLPEPLRSRVIEKLAGSGAKGLYHEGNVYLFSQHLEGEADVEFTLFHEAYGHLGLRAVLGEKFDQFLETAYRTRPEVREAADALIADGMPKLEAIDEVLSDMAGANRNVSVVKQWVGKIISGLREIGFARVADWFASMTDAEVASTLAAARDAVRNGTLPAMNGAPSEVRFKEVKPPYEVFATKGGKTTGYARYNPVTDSWAVFSADGENIKDGYTTTTTQDFQDVVQAMKHRGKVEYRLRSGLFVDDKIVADLVELPQFNDTKKYSIWDPRRWAQIRRTAQIQFQNEYLPVFEVIDYLASKGRITPQTDVKTALMLYERRAGYLVEQFRKRFAEPIQKLVEQAGKLGVTKKDIDRYLTARHAFERNAVIASINPEMPDGGSGLTNQQADDILRAVRSSPAGQVLEEIGRLTDKMGKEKVNYLSQTGMITKKLAEKLRGYDHYINLSDDDQGALAGGSKFNVKGAERRALGRGAGNEAENVLEKTLQGFEAALIRGQKNIVAQKVLALIETNYSPEFAVVNRQAFKKQFNPETGEVEEALDENYMARKDVMVAKVGGIPTTIEFKERGAGSFADAIHGMVSPGQSGPIMESVGKVSRFLGSLMTTYNPVFTVVNFVRDAQTMYLNAAADGKISKKMARDMVKALPTAIRAAIHEASGGRFGQGANSETLRVLREMQREGGITYFADRKSLEDQVKKLDDLLSGKKYPMQETFQKIGSVMEFLADVSEMAPRLAAYKVVRENGFSKEQAAVFSGDITVNFNMRGANKEVRQLYVFFNPAVQGSYKLYKLATTKDGQKQFARMAMALTAFGFLTSLLGRALSGEDDDGIDKLDKVPVYKRATSVVLAADVPGGAPLPIPYGWNAFFATGVFMADTVLGKQPMSVTATRIAKTTAESFSPIGSGASDAKSFETFMAKFVAPTSLLPGVEFLANENRFGAPIRKEQSPFDASRTPDAQQYFRGVSPISKAITDGLTSLTKGNKYHAGGIDVNPATIDFLIQSYLPGLPSDAYKGAGAAIKASTGEDVKRAPWPLLDRFSARIPTGYDAGAYRRASEMVETVYQEYSKTRDQGRRQEIRAEYPRIGYAHAVIASTTQELRQVRKQISDLETRPMSDDARVQRKNQLMDREEVIFKKATKKLMEAGEPIREAMMANE